MYKKVPSVISPPYSFFKFGRKKLSRINFGSHTNNHKHWIFATDGNRLAWWYLCHVLIRQVYEVLERTIHWSNIFGNWRNVCNYFTISADCNWRCQLCPVCITHRQKQRNPFNNLSNIILTLKFWGVLYRDLDAAHVGHCWSSFLLEVPLFFLVDSLTYYTARLRFFMPLPVLKAFGKVLFDSMLVLSAAVVIRFSLIYQQQAVNCARRCSWPQRLISGKFGVSDSTLIACSCLALGIFSTDSMMGFRAKIIRILQAFSFHTAVVI